MKNSAVLFSSMVLALAAGNASAAGAPVNIASPINGATVKNQFYSSFTTTCPGGQYTVQWYFDSTSTPIGTATFYNTAGVHFAHNLPIGAHTLTVSSSCGRDTVKFIVQ